MKILIVDADPGVASSLAEGITAKGLAATSVATADEAIDWINANAGCDILIADIFMQPTDGFTLRETVQPHVPKMKTIFLSAYDVSTYGERIGGRDVVMKPATPESLEAAIRKFVPRVVAQPKVATPRVATADQPGDGTPAGQWAQPLAGTATPTAKPKAPVVAARPKAASAATGSKTATGRLSIGGEIELPPDELVGRTIGNYEIEAKIGHASMGPIYRARQTTVERLVRLYVLDPARSTDPAALERFIANASVKAQANNPLIIAVYEAGESEGIYFYSCEYIPSRSVAQLKESGGKLDETTALQILRTAAEVLSFFGREKIQHELISENSILIGPQNRPRIANISSHQSAQQYDLPMEMATLGRIVLGALPPAPATPISRELALSLVNPETAPPSWAAFLQTIAAKEPKAAPTDAYKLDAQERAAIRMVEQAKKRQKRMVLINMCISLALLAAALFAVYLILFRPKGNAARPLDDMVRIPAGEFIYQNGEKVTLPEFYISEHEVTIAQYAKFLEFLEKNPDKAGSFDHPKQPKGKTHVPDGWADMKELRPPMPGYYTRAIKWGRYKEAELDVNSPVFGVDWFDAYAYANWKGQRLPTEQEWEKAARGNEGRPFPWGDNEDPTRANTNIDLDPNPKKGGDKDGFKRWNPVDAKKSDKSPFGVIGTAGNVSEWTATYAESPELGGDKVPVIRGGNWKTTDHTVTRRVVKLMDLQFDDALGFRTASDTPPEKK